MAQAVAETLPTVDMVKKAMLSIGGGRFQALRHHPFNHRHYLRLAGRFARQFFTKHLGCMGLFCADYGPGKPVRTQTAKQGPDCCGKCFVRFVMLKRVEVAWLRFILDHSGEFSQ